MKINKIAIILTSVIAMSCTGDFEDMNKDPMAVSEVSPKLILPVMMNSGYHLVAGDYQRATTLYSALYCQYFANTANILPILPIILRQTVICSILPGRNAVYGVLITEMLSEACGKLPLL